MACAVKNSGTDAFQLHSALFHVSMRDNRCSELKQLQPVLALINSAVVLLTSGR